MVQVLMYKVMCKKVMTARQAGVLAWSGNVYFGLQYVVSCRVHARL